MTQPSDPRAASNQDYWRKNLTYVGALLVVWFSVSYGAGILFVEPLNQFRLPGTGFPLGFWFAQQGSIVVFVLVILVYCLALNRLDAQHHTELERIRADRAATAGSTHRS
jgi:putative solute:sodium symporter small subunit